MKHALVTGGAGFIGSHLAEALIARGDRVTVLDDLSTGNAANLGPVSKQPNFRFVQGSLSDTSLLRTLLADVDELYHLAAAVGAPGGQRAVGRANGLNRIAIVIPCHRVVRKDGQLGGYGGGLRRKQFLLELEQARLVRGQRRQRGPLGRA